MSLTQFRQQRLRVFQVRRIKAFREPIIDRREKIVGFGCLPYAPATAGPGSWRRAVPRIWHSGGEQLQERCEKRLLIPHDWLATAGATARP